MATAGPLGLQIHALRQRLRAQGYCHVLSLYPTSWQSDVSTVNLNQQS
jgi:hypothetical protein